MQKIYVLLRNNQQTGPYHLEELIQFDLKPYDLIWIQGKSAGWYYPQEIQALHPYLPFVKKPVPAETNTVTPRAKTIESREPKKPFVSMPANFKIEEPLVPETIVKKEETVTYTPYEAPAPFVYPVKEPDALEAAVYQVRETKAEMPPISQPKRKKQPVVSTTGIILACLIVGVVGYFMAKPFMATADDTSPEQTISSPAQNEVQPDNSLPSGSTQNSSNPLFKKQKQQKQATVVKEITTIIRQAPNDDEETYDNNPPVTNNEATPVNEEDKTVVEENKNEPVVTEAPTEKKKTIRDKIFDIFRKKPQESKKEESKPAEDEGERRSTRRETDRTQMVSVRFTIPNDWMAGIKGAKATLTNRGSETLSKVVIEVTYYNDDEQLVDKRTVSFGRIEGKSSQTITIPDHATATKLDYTVISVAGNASQPYAKL